MANNDIGSAYHDPDSFKHVTQCCRTRRNNLSFFHMNAHSLKSKYDEISVHPNSFHFTFDALAFADTLFNTDSKEEVTFPGYNCLMLSRKQRRGGGLRNHIIGNIVPHLSQITSNLESLIVECSDTVLAVVYRPPSGTQDAFLRFLKILQNMPHCPNFLL